MKQQHPGFHSSLEDLLALTRFAVEANTFEQHSLWHANHKKVSWVPLGFGFGVPLGNFGDMPVMLSAMFATIEGHLVMFYHATSQVVDHRMVEAWLDKNVTAKWDNSQRRCRCDAGNFYFCLQALAELNASEKQDTGNGPAAPATA